MENPLVIVHRSLRLHPAQRHTPPSPPPNAPQRHPPQPATLLQDTKKAKDGFPSFSWCHIKKRRAGENTTTGPPRAEIAKDNASTLNTAPAICEYTRKYKIESKKRFFKLFLRIRTDDASLISEGMLFQIFSPLKQIERKPFCRVFFAR